MYLNYKTLINVYAATTGAIFNVVFISVLVLLREASRSTLSNIAVSCVHWIGEHKTIIDPSKKASH